LSPARQTREQIGRRKFAGKYTMANFYVILERFEIVGRATTHREEGLTDGHVHCEIFGVAPPTFLNLC
jgi:hypothetical protein